MTFLAILKMSAAVFTIAFGLYSVIRPRAIKSFTGLDVTGPRGVTEVRAVMGGTFALLLAEKYPSLYSGVLDISGNKDTFQGYAYMTTLASMTVPEIRSYLNLTPIYPDGLVQYLKSFGAGGSSAILNETGGTPTANPKAYEDVSPTYHANISIPVITIHSTGDLLVPFSEVTLYQAAVAKAGRSNLYRVYSTPPVVPGVGNADANVQAQVPIRFDELVSWANALDGWTLTADGRSIKAYPDLKEYVWQKNASMAPNGPYDKIGLHRLVKTGITPKGVVFFMDGSVGGNGERTISNPPTDNWTKLENYSQPIYWANRGFEVYAMDLRNHFVPRSLNVSQLSFMQNWGWDQWISDLKEAVEKAKDASGVKKIFMVGYLEGAQNVLNYATLYGKDDLKGII